jgi:hypothetical protein
VYVQNFADKGYLKIKNASDEMVEVALSLVKAKSKPLQVSV